MTAFIVASTLWIGLLLGSWLLVGRSLGRGFPEQARRTAYEAAERREQGRDPR